MNKSSQLVLSLILMSLLASCFNQNNCFFVFSFIGLASKQGECRPFIACGHQIGLIRPDVAFALANYPDVFTETSHAFYLNSQVSAIRACQILNFYKIPLIFL